MQLRNSLHTYGWVSILLHWGMAIALIGMYLVGDYMVVSAVVSKAAPC